MLPSALSDLVNILEYITRESGSLAVGRRFVGELRRNAELWRTFRAPSVVPGRNCERISEV